MGKLNFESCPIFILLDDMLGNSVGIKKVTFFYMMTLEYTEVTKHQRPSMQWHYHISTDGAQLYSKCMGCLFLISGAIPIKTELQTASGGCKVI